MNKLIVLDSNFEAEYILDTYESLIWTSRYRDAGEFELEVPVTPENIRKLPVGKYILNEYFYDEEANTAHLMVIETVDIEEQSLKISGRSLKSLLDRRIVWGQAKIDKDMAVQTAISTIVNDNVINPSIVNRAIQNFVFDTADYDFGTISESIQYEGNSILEVVNDLCTKNKPEEEREEYTALGYTVYYNFNDHCFHMNLIVPTDRSLEQTDHDAVIFSSKHKNIKSNKYIESSTTFHNVGYVSGERYSDDELDHFHQIAIVGTPDAAGIDRRECFIDASDLQHVYSTTDEHGHEHGDEYSHATYQDMLVQRGTTELKKKEHSYSRVFEGEIDPGINPYIFNRDYFIGDIVEIVNDYDITKRVRVIEMVLSISTSAVTAIPTFEDIDTESNAELEYAAIEGGTEHIAYMTEGDLTAYLDDNEYVTEDQVPDIVNEMDLDYHSSLIKTNNRITGEITAREGDVEVLSSRIDQTAHTIDLTVSQSGANSTAGITITLKDADGNIISTSPIGYINMNGIVTFSSLLDTNTVIDGGCISTGNIVAGDPDDPDAYSTVINTDNGKLTWNMQYSVLTSNGLLTFYNTEYDSGSSSSVSQPGIQLITGEQGTYGWSATSLFSNYIMLSYKPSSSTTSRTYIYPGGLSVFGGREGANDASINIRATADRSQSVSEVYITKYDYKIGATHNVAWQGEAADFSSLKVNGTNVLTSHQSLSSCIKTTGDWTMSGSLQSKGGITVQSESSKYIAIGSTNINGYSSTANADRIVLQANGTAVLRVGRSSNSTADNQQYVQIPSAYARNYSDYSSRKTVWVSSGGTLAGQSPSSKRYKESITYLDENELIRNEIIFAAKSLRPSMFRYKEGVITEPMYFNESYNSALYAIGLIAEDVKESVGDYGVNYIEDGDELLVENWNDRPVLVMTLALAQENTRVIEEQQREIDDLKDRLSKLEALLEKGGESR